MDQAQTAQGVVYGRVVLWCCRDKKGNLMPRNLQYALVRTNLRKYYTARFKDIKGAVSPLRPGIILRGTKTPSLRLVDVEVEAS